MTVNNKIECAIIPHKINNNISRIVGIKNIIAITSGKGGVGKSFVAINMAIRLSELGFKIAMLDADIYGPSIPALVNSTKFKPEIIDNKFIPLERYGIKIMSFGFLINEKQPAIWRGAIVIKAIEQMLFDTLWGDVDILFIDMPPGTGDIHLSMCQKMPITAVVTVTTAQLLSLLDVVRSIEMYKKLNIPNLGILENMSTHVCKNCNFEEEIFGKGEGSLLSTEYNIPFLGSIPLSGEINQLMERGEIITLKDEKMANIFTDIVKNLLSNLSLLPKDYSHKIGKINII